MSEININKPLINNKMQYILVLLVILINARAPNFIGNNVFIISVFIFTFFLFAIKRLAFDKIIIYIIIYWILVNLASYWYNKTKLDYITFFGYLIKLLSYYFIIKLVGFEFFKKLEKTIFILTIISLPIYLLEQIYRDQFYSLAPILNFMTGEEQKAFGGWYIFIYLFSGWMPGRNSGFMWEPGAFALMIILGILLHFYLNGFLLKKSRVVVYICAMITTFSTMGYIIFIVLFAGYILQKRKPLYWFLLFPVLILIVYYIKDLPFLIPELETHYARSDIFKLKSIGDGIDVVKANRLGFINLAIRESINWPFGYGNVISKNVLADFNKEQIMGGSTFAHLLLLWGWFGIYFWIRSTFLFFSRISGNRIKTYIILISTICLILAFSSNPLPKSPILLMIVFTPYIFNFKKTKKPLT